MVRDDTNWLFAFHPCGSFDMFKNSTGKGDFACLDAAVGPLNYLLLFVIVKLKVDSKVASCC